MFMCTFMLLELRHDHSIYGFLLSITSFSRYLWQYIIALFFFFFFFFFFLPVFLLEQSRQRIQSAPLYLLFQ
ncbi:hypothetical protein ACN42_g8725 [Penicillium freii]|uniref:Uncharacterized protein n=1 Tax=Penicillium freii TaxID=48697 RepID=A0A101MD78_PENFR|nr:hypothetical protein ACN42_g8725 [Penicillium freii]